MTDQSTSIHGPRCFVVLADVPHEFSFKVRHGCENTASNDIAFELGKPQLDLIEPE